MTTKNTVLLALLLFGSTQLLIGCGASQVREGSVPAKRQLSDVMEPGDTTLLERAYDPWEGYNRRMYNFNARFDRYVLIPASEGYKRALPKIVRTGVHNFMRNIREVLNVTNAVLQLRGKTAARSTGRFVVNSTVGIGGLFDPATQMGLYYQKEDFGQTLGRWGVGPGPYFVLPFFGPSTLRDSFGLGADYVIWQEINIAGYPEWEEDQTLNWPVLLNALDTRANVNFRYYESGTIYEYLWIRQMYLELREFEILR